MNLDQKALIQTILSVEDYSEAGTALTELSFINLEKAGDLAFDILKNKKGDCHLQANAFDVLYFTNQSFAFQFIEDNLDAVNLIVFGSMLESVTEDSSLVHENNKLFKIVKKLKSKASSLGLDDRKKIKDTLDWLRKSFLKI